MLQNLEAIDFLSVKSTFVVMTCCHLRLLYAI